MWEVFKPFTRRNVIITHETYININWRDVQRKNGVNNVDIKLMKGKSLSSLRTPWQNGPYTTKKHRTTQKHVNHQDATDIQKKTFLCFLDFSFYLLFINSKMMSPRNVELPSWYGQWRSLGV